MHIVLHQPEIPSNTGNIGRTCAATGSRLHLIRPLGFSINEKALKRAGMDYWDELDVRVYINFSDFLEKNPSIGNGESRLFMATTKARRTYCDVTYGKNDYIMFGRESGGIPEQLLVDNEEGCIRIPMLDGTRSLNLANSTSIILYEALRQQGFEGLTDKGSLHDLEWRTS
ncbi:MAG: tRNA (cytidine(34)-2'-O)-methyltransferase [Lachnospiraceae bacterium]|nr:tRNA (cytidine(34)-2'-O)-methyltransferase [Lachnospiraceae bacterium]